MMFDNLKFALEQRDDGPVGSSSERGTAKPCDMCDIFFNQPKIHTKHLS